jgi:hypothetical protein
MITKPSVFVIGAGGSRPYGFPLGAELVGDVLAPLRRLSAREREGRSTVKEIVEELGLKNTYDEFLKALRTSGYPSVDRFLEKNPRFDEIGRLAIAYALLPCETDDRLFPPHAPRRDHWYEVFANILELGDRRKYLRSPVTIITYNYDRSLEYYLGNLMLNRLPRRGRTLWRHHDHIPILHLHGTLGQLGVGDDCVSYETAPNAKYLQLAARGISVVHTAKPNTHAFTAARRALRDAERIYFLGFGYNPVNVARLRVFDHAWSLKKRARCIVRGTSVGMSRREWEQTCQVTFNGNMAPQPGYRSSITTFLREAVDLD